MFTIYHLPFIIFWHAWMLHHCDHLIWWKSAMSKINPETQFFFLSQTGFLFLLKYFTKTKFIRTELPNIDDFLCCTMNEESFIIQASNRLVMGSHVGRDSKPSLSTVTSHRHHSVYVWYINM